MQRPLRWYPKGSWVYDPKKAILETFANSPFSTVDPLVGTDTCV